MLEQETNAYAVLPEAGWRGYRPPQVPPGPLPGTWGGTDAHAIRAGSGGAGGPARGRSTGGGQRPATDPKDGLAAALARLGRALMAKNA